MTDIPVTPAGEQPGQGDGSSGSGSTPWNLEAHPEELRPYLAEELKKIEGGITPKLQEAAELRKQFGHLAEIEGIADVPAEELQELLAFRQIAQDPEALQEWWAAIGEELGFFTEGGPEGEGEPGQGEGDEPPAWAQQLMERLEALEGTTRQSEEQQREQQREQRALAKIDTDLKALHEKFGDFDEDAVCSLAMAYEDDPDCIAKGFADYQRITGRAQSELVDGAEKQPGPALGGGAPNTTPEPISWNGNGQNPKDLARARLSSAR